MIIMRSVAAKSETVTWPAVSPNFAWPFWKPSLCTLAEFEGLEPKKPDVFDETLNTDLTRATLPCRAVQSERFC